MYRHVVTPLELKDGTRSRHTRLNSVTWDPTSRELIYLSNEAGLTGLWSCDPATGKRKAFYEPVHGSAPDIAGQGIANPIAMIASFAMALRYSFNMIELATQVENAISAVLSDGLRTGDIAQDNCRTVGTEEMGAAILAKLKA